MRGQKAVALILAIGILAIISAVATSFMLSMRLEYKVAVNYYRGMRSRYLAEAAAEEAIALLKLDAASNAFSFTPSFSRQVSTSDGEEAGSSNAVIEDETSKLNISNAGDAVIENLISYALGVTNQGVINRIRAAITGNRDSQSLYELKSKMRAHQIEEDYIDALMPYLTVSASGNSIFNSSVNVNTASDVVLKSVLKNAGGINAAQLEQVVSAIQNARPVTHWAEFNNIFYDPANGTSLYANGTLSMDQANAIIEACNPNRATLPPSGTKFCLQPGGYYTIEGNGASAEGGSATVVARVYIYDIIHQTSEDDFKNGDINFNYTCWRDNCPTRFGGSETVDGSVKLGFFDDFEDAIYTNRYWNTTPSNGYLETNWNGVIPPGSAWSNFNLRVDANDQGSAADMRTVATVNIRNDLGVLHSRQGTLSWGGNMYAYLLNPETGLVQHMTAEGYIHSGYAQDTEEAISERWRYGDGQVRLFTSGRDSRDDDEVDDYRTSLKYTAMKRFNIASRFDPAAGLNKVSITVTNNEGSAGTLEVDLSTLNAASSGSITLYSHAIRTEWDDFHAMEDSGEYASAVITPPAGGEVRWGTITGTLSHSTNESSKQGDISLGISETSSVSIADGGFAIIDQVSSGLQYTAYFSSGDDDIIEAPILEDVTITYLPDTELKSFAFK